MLSFCVTVPTDVVTYWQVIVRRDHLLQNHLSPSPSPLKNPPKWRKCESYQDNGLRGWRPERTMDRMDRPRTSIDERMLSGRCAVVIV